MPGEGYGEGKDAGSGEGSHSLHDEARQMKKDETGLQQFKGRNNRNAGKHCSVSQLIGQGNH